MKVRSWLQRFTGMLVDGVLAVVVTACGSTPAAPANGTGQAAASASKAVQEIRMGTSSSGSDYYVQTVGMSNILNKNTSLKTSVVAAGGSDATARAMADNKADVGLLNLWSLTKAVTGQPPFDKPVALRQVLYGMPSGFYIIARASSGIQTPADLKGKRLIGKRPALQSLDEFTQTLLSVYGLSTADVTLLSTAETNEAIQAMEQGTVDAVVLPGSANAPPQQQLAENTPVRFIQIPDDKIQQIIARMTQGAMVIPVPDGRYKGQPHDYKLVGYPTVLAVRADLPDDTVYTLTKTLLDHASDLAAISVTAKEWTLPNTLSNPHFAVPFHPGAIRYFKEKGVWTDTLQAQQDQLLQKMTGH